jgi:tetratricopeptide (TPR) repeat protein
MDDIAEDAFARGLFLLENGEWAEALAAFEKAHADEPGNARYRSYYGLALGIVERRFQVSSELCNSAAKQEFFNPNMYLNLARLHRSFGFKTEAVRYLRRGRMIDPAHAEIGSELRSLGRRGRPMLPFLPRTHRLNRWCGMARSAFARPQRWLAA